MDFLSALLNSGLQFVLMAAVMVAAIVLGAKLRSSRDESKKASKETDEK